MTRVYYLNPRNGELRRAGGTYVSTYDGDIAVAMEAILNEGYSFLTMDETYVFFVKRIEE
jgi:hypothetical protein